MGGEKLRKNALTDGLRPIVVDSEALRVWDRPLQHCSWDASLNIRSLDLTWWPYLEWHWDEIFTTCVKRMWKGFAKMCYWPIYWPILLFSAIVKNLRRVFKHHQRGAGYYPPPPQSGAVTIQLDPEEYCTTGATDLCWCRCPPARVDPAHCPETPQDKNASFTRYFGLCINICIDSRSTLRYNTKASMIVV